MKTKVIIALIFLLGTELFSQGMNNDFPVDSMDNKIIFNMLGIEMFKFPIKKLSYKCKFRIKKIEYQNNKLTDSSIITEGLPEDCLYLYKKDRMFRYYVQNIDSNTIKFIINIGSATLTQVTNYGNIQLGLSQSRAYSDYQPEKGKSVPMLIWYGYKDNKKNSIHCPGDAPIEKVAQLYDFVVAFVIEIEEIK